MIKLFQGEDTFESYVNASKEAKSLATKKNLEIKMLNADDIDKIDEFTQEIEGVGMFSSESIIFLKRLFKNKKLVTYLEENFERLNTYNIIIWQDSKADGRSSFVKKLAKAKSIFTFNLLKEWQMNKWISGIARAKKVNISNDQIDYVVERLGTDKWIILNELNKLKIYQDTVDNELKKEDIDKILGFDVNGDIWKFLDFFGNLQRVEMLEEFEKLNKFESNIQYLIAMLTRELNLLSKVKYATENQIEIKSLGIHPFVLQKTIKKTKNFSYETIKILLKKLLQLDYEIKQGEIEEITGMALFLAGI